MLNQLAVINFVTGSIIPGLICLASFVPPSALASPVADEYRISGGDNIGISIPALEFKADYQIPLGGTISVPLVGTISVQGLTVTQITEQLITRYRQYLKQPQVTVIFLAARPLNIWVAGEVTRPGSYTIPLTAGAGIVPAIQYPTLMQALEIAQGVTQAADLRQVQIRRSSPDGSQRLLTFDLWEFLQTGHLAEDLTLRDGDAIVVPTADEMNLAQARPLIENSFGTDPELPRTVAVVGEVNRPGTYVVIGGNTVDYGTKGLPTVTRAIQLAGGIKPSANIRQIRIRRPTNSGGEHRFEINLWELLQSGDITQDTILQNGDTIIIPTATEINPREISELAEANFSPRTIRINVIGEVERPGTLDLPPNTTLNQALLAGGGFNRRANTRVIKLVRLNFDGTVSQQQIDINLASAIDEQVNPLLRNHDILFIGRSGLSRFSDTLNIAFEPAAGALSVLQIPDSFLRLLGRLGIVEDTRNQEVVREVIRED